MLDKVITIKPLPTKTVFQEYSTKDIDDEHKQFV